LKHKIGLTPTLIFNDLSASAAGRLKNLNENGFRTNYSPRLKSRVSLVNFMRKYGIREGMKVKFIETEAGALIIPIPKLEDLHGVDLKHASKIIECVRELEAEHREEAQATARETLQKIE